MDADSGLIPRYMENGCLLWRVGCLINSSILQSPLYDVPFPMCQSLGSMLLAQQGHFLQ